MPISKLKLNITDNHITLYGTKDKVYSKPYDIIKRLTKLPMGSNLRVFRSDKEIAHMETYYMLVLPNDKVEIVYVSLISCKVMILASATVSSFKNWGTVVDNNTLSFFEALRKVRSTLHILDFTDANVTDCVLCYIGNCTWCSDADGIVTLMYYDLLNVKRCSLQTAWKEVTAEKKNPKYTLVAYNNDDDILFFV